MRQFFAAMTMALLLAGCAAPAATIVAGTDYRSDVAKALDHYTDAKPAKRYSISEPFVSLAGGDMAVCVRKDITDGNGRAIETDARSIYIFEAGKLQREIDGSNASVCRIKDYTPLPPAVR